jgi:hexulose-6-phosphate isomerase
MENPHWDTNGEDIERQIIGIIEAMSKIGAQILVIPLVDNSSISKNREMDLDFFANLKSSLKRNNVRVAFELDLNPVDARNFINQFEAKYFGINFDMGNSASLGYSPEAEISNYGDRIINVHVKDRILGGHTVALGSGNVDFKVVVEQLKKVSFQGNFIMQTARASDDNHSAELMRNIDFFEGVLLEN